MLMLTLMPLGEGRPEERATFGTFALYANGRCLTEGVAADSKELLPGPLVSGYHIAEWLAWNVWRLLWEARSDGPGHEWAFAHRLSSIGAGYLWPNIEISSDGVYAEVRSTPTADSAPGLYRYVGAPAVEVVPAKDLGSAIEGFVGMVLEHVDEAGVGDTNLHRIWQELDAARRNAASVRLRRLEARLGCDPDEVGVTGLHAAMASADDLGHDAIDELVADAGARRTRDVPGSGELIAFAKRAGVDANPADGATLPDDEDRPAFGKAAAWRVGVATAQALRQQQALDGQPVDNKALCGLAGTREPAIAGGNSPSGLSFMLATGARSRVALRSKWETGRRFDLARLLGDRLLGQEEPLLPATRAYTYRQKAQRAFAAELLCPYHAVRDFLDADRSAERREEAANHFNVSPLAISTVLANNEPERYPLALGSTLPL